MAIIRTLATLCGLLFAVSAATEVSAACSATQPGCLACSEDSGCTEVDVENGFFLTQDANGLFVSERCIDHFGAGCTQCDAETGCTAAVEGLFTTINPMTRRNEAAKCRDHFGSNCATCDGTACTSLISPEIGTLCRTNPIQGLYCLSALGSRCATCYCDRGNPRCLTNNGVNSFVDEEGAVQTCKEGYSNGCNNCNSTQCITPESGFALLPGNPVPQTCGSLYGEGCRWCNATACTGVTSGIYGINSQGMAVPCSEITGEGTNTCGAVAVTDPATNQRVTVWQCSSVHKGYRCNYPQPGALAKTSIRCPDPESCAACDADGYCTQAHAGFCLNRMAAAVSTDPKKNAYNISNYDLTLCRKQIQAVDDPNGDRQCTLQINKPADAPVGISDVLPNMTVTVTQDVWVNFQLTPGTGYQCATNKWTKISAGTTANLVPDCPSQCGTNNNQNGQGCFSFPFYISLASNYDETTGVVTPLNDEQCPVELVANPNGPGECGVTPPTPGNGGRRRQVGNVGVADSYASSPDAGFAFLATINEQQCKNTGGKVIYSGRIPKDCECPEGSIYVQELNGCMHLERFAATYAPKPQCDAANIEQWCGSTDPFALNRAEACIVEKEKHGDWAVICRCQNGLAVAPSLGSKACETVTDPTLKLPCFEHGQGRAYIVDNAWSKFCDWQGFWKGVFNNNDFSLSAEDIMKNIQKDKEMNQFFKNHPELNYRPKCWNEGTKSACYCHRNCAVPQKNYTVVRQATFTSDHCEAVTVFQTDKCCDYNQDGTPVCLDDDTLNPVDPLPRVNFTIRANGLCCPGSGLEGQNGCHVPNICGDPHLVAGFGTTFDAYQRDGEFRVMEYLVFDRVTKKSELVTVDAHFTSSGNTYMKDLTIDVAGKKAKYVFGAALTNGEAALKGPDGQVTDIVAAGGYAEVRDEDGNPAFIISYNIPRREFSIKLSRDPHVGIYLRNPNRELRIQLIKANAAARYEWVATAGLTGFNLPRPFDNVIPDIERRQMRGADLIDRNVWNQFVTSCLSAQSGSPCDPTPLRAISNPKSFWNGVPVGPADSSFMGWAGIDAYAGVLSNNTVHHLKTAGCQRCFANEYSLTWANDLSVLENPTRIFAQEHLNQCAACMCEEIDTLYANVPGYVSKRVVRRQAPGNGNNGKKPENGNNGNGNGNGNNGNGNGNNGNNGNAFGKDKKKVNTKYAGAAARGLKALKTDCPVNSNGQYECPSVLYLGGASAMLVGQAAPAVVENFDPESGPAEPELKAVIKSLDGTNECVFVDSEGFEEETTDCRNFPATARTAEIVIVDDSGETAPKRLPSAMVDLALARISEFISNEMNAEGRRRNFEHNHDLLFRMQQIHDDCVRDVVYEMAENGDLGFEPETRCATPPYDLI